MGWTTEESSSFDSQQGQEISSHIRRLQALSGAHPAVMIYGNKKAF
jgi:hypothetical protein